MKYLLVGLFAVSLLAIATPAAADDPGPAPAVTPVPRSGPTLRLPEERVYGHVHRPMVIFVLERSRVNYHPPDLETTFVDRILRTTEPLR